jgi:hypothetical protein
MGFMYVGNRHIHEYFDHRIVPVILFSMQTIKTRGAITSQLLFIRHAFYGVIETFVKLKTRPIH